MTRCTITQAWARICRLAPADAGRLIGYRLLDHTIPPVPAGNLTDEAAQLLHDNLYRDGTPVTGDSIAYVISCDGTPIAWLTHSAKVVLPAVADDDLTSYQAAHQINAAGALTQLTRYAYVDLARRRDLREQRDQIAGHGTHHDTTGVLVANPAEPTLTWWTTLPTGLDRAREHLAAVTGGDGEVLVLDAYGYGNYARDTSLLPTSVLCTIDALAAEHDLPAWVIGDWLTAEGAPRSQPDADTVRAAFGSSYRGLFPSQLGYARAAFEQRGWRHALAAADIPERLFDMGRFTADLFRDEVRDVRAAGGQIAVFTR